MGTAALAAALAHGGLKAAAEMARQYCGSGGGGGGRSVVAVLCDGVKRWSFVSVCPRSVTMRLS